MKKTFVYAVFVLSMWSVFSLMAPQLGAELTNIAGSGSFPRQWQVFGPLSQDDPVVETNILKTIPTELDISGRKFRPITVTVQDPFNRFDLAPLLGGTRAGKTAYVFIPLESPSDSEVTLGMGADWWLQAWLDGNLIADTTKDGNGPWPPTIHDHLVTVHLNKGTHVLAVRFISGSGSSILALGGPDDLRKGQPTFPLFKNDPMPANNLVTNGGFEDGTSGDPFVPSGWENGKGQNRFQKTELTARTEEPISGTRSLEINTLRSGSVKRKLYIPLSVDLNTLYHIMFKAHHLEGIGYASVSIRDNMEDGFNTGFARAIGVDNSGNGIKKGQLGTCTGYYFLDTPNPCLVIETHGPVHLIIDDVSVSPTAKDNMWKGWNEQRAPWKFDWNTLGETIVTPHTSWAKPYAGGSLKVLSVMPRKKQRLTVELAQRLSMQYTPVFFEYRRSPNSPSELGRDYWTYDVDGDPQMFLKETDTFKRLAQPADCIVIAELNTSAISPALAEAILNRVETGTGLIITGSRWNRLDLAKFKEGPWAKALNDNNATREQTDFVQVGGASLNTSPETRKYEPYKSDFVGFYQYGQGRIMIWSGHMEETPRANFEADISHMIKAMLWAARKLPVVRLESVKIPGTTKGVLQVGINSETLPLRFTVKITEPVSDTLRLNAWIDDYQNESALPLGAATWADGGQEAVLELPVLPSGTHRLHLQLKRGDQVEDWTTLVLDVTSKYGITAITLNDTKPYHTEGDTVAGSVQLSMPLASNQTLRIELRDSDDHLWQTRELRGEGSKIDFTLTLQPVITLIQRLRVKLLAPQGTLAESTLEFPVVRRPEWYADTFDYQLWCVPAELSVCRELRKQGVTSATNSFNSWNMPLNNMRPVPAVGSAWEGENKPGVYYPGHVTKIVGDTAHAPIRYPCLNDPDFREQTKQKISSDLKFCEKYAPLAYFLAHEWNYRGYGTLSGPVDTCFCNYCLESFRNFVRAEYGSIAELNASWGSDFKTWEDVSPIVLADALKTGQIPRWIDHRRHADRVFADFLKFKLNAVRNIDPGAQGIVTSLRVGLTTLDSYSGVDFWLLYHDAGLVDNLSPYVLSFIPRESEKRGLITRNMPMWHPDKNTGDENLFRLRLSNKPWINLLDGAHGFTYYEEYFFEPPDTPWHPILNADLSIGVVGPANESVAQIRSGIDRFIFESKLLDSGIAILYSRSSEHAATAWQALHKNNSLAPTISPPGQIGFYTAALNALGYQFRLVSEDQVAGRMLTKDGFRLLILPFSQAISVGAVEQIREFVKGGGCLLADIRPGVSDQHGKPGTAGSLDDVFGIQQQTDYSYEPTEHTVGTAGMPSKTDQKIILPHALCGPFVKTIGARILDDDQHSKPPAFLVNRFGRGQATLLNFVLREVDENALQMIQGVLTSFGLKPLFGVEAPETRQSRPTIIVGESKEAPADAEGYAAEVAGIGRPILSDFVNGQIHSFGFRYPVRRGIGFERLRITPPVSGHIYNLKTNEYMGWKTSFTVSLPLEDTAVYASVPYRIQPPSLTLTHTISSEGLSTIHCLARLHPDEAMREKQVVKFRIFAPGGVEWPDFAVTRTASDGKAEHRFVLPLNAPRGNWNIEVREAISGLAERKSFSL